MKDHHEQYLKLCMELCRDPSKARLLRDRMVELLRTFG